MEQNDTILLCNEMHNSMLYIAAIVNYLHPCTPCCPLQKKSYLAAIVECTHAESGTATIND